MNINELRLLQLVSSYCLLIKAHCQNSLNFVIVFCKVDFSLKFLYYFYECGNNFWKKIIPKYCTAFIELMENVCIKFALLVRNNAWYVIGSGYILGINNIAPWILLLLMFGYSTLKKKLATCGDFCSLYFYVTL